jgi:hypothetical protein
MSHNGAVQNRKQRVPESGVHDMNEKTPLLKKEDPRRPTERQPPSTTRSHLIRLAVVLTLFGAGWLAQMYYPVTDLRPYAICARRESVIFTVDATRPTAQCMVVDEQGRIADIGSAGT